VHIAGDASKAAFRSGELQFECSLCLAVEALRRRNILTILLFPEALNQDRPLSAADVTHYLAFMALFGCVAYLGAFWQFWMFTRFLLRRSYGTVALHRSSTVFGVAAVLFMPTIYVAHFIVPEGMWGVIEVGVMITFFVTPFVVAVRILRRSNPSSETALIKP
jgi:hypothetical protein